MPARRNSDQLSPATDTAHTRQVKRTKTSSACDACRTRRSRCELVNQDGCNRCRVLGTLCSLRNGMLVDEETATAVLRTPLERDHQLTLLQVDKRAARIEQMVAQILRRERQSSRTASHLEDSDFGTVDHEETWSGAARQLLGGIGQLRDARLLDPVRLGLVSEEDMNMRQANLSTLPYTIPVDDSYTMPRNALIRCAILRLDSPPDIIDRLDSVIYRNLALLPFLRPSRDLLRAFVILSYATPASHRFNRSCDPYGVCPKLLDMARSLGLDDRLDTFKQEDWSDYGEEWMQPILSDVALWYASVHRAAINSFFTSPSCSTQSHSYTLANLLPLGLAQPLKPTLFHLASESELLEMLRPMSTAIRVLRTARLYQENHTASIIAAADDLKISLDLWRDQVKQASLPSTDYLIILSLQIEMTIYLRASTEAGPALPTPLGHERRSPIISRLGKEYVRVNLDHIRHVLDQQVPLGTLPSWNFMLSFLPYATLRSIKQLHEPDVPFDLDLLESYHTYLLRSHPTASGILDGIGKTRTDPGWKSHADSQGPDISPPLTNDLDWWTMFDWLPPLESSLGTDLFTDIGLGL